MIEEEIKKQNSRGILLVLTGPTGSGKDTVIDGLKENNPEIVKLTTTSTRAMRPDESEGSPYHFISREKFEHMIAQDDFFEWVEFRGELYGTQKIDLTSAINSGKDVIWKIEMKGIKNIKEKIKREIPRSVFVFLTADTVTTLKKRVEEAPGGTKDRWNESIVLWEMQQYDDCDYLVINEQEKLENTIQIIEGIVEAKRREIINV